MMRITRSREAMKVSRKVVKTTRASGRRWGDGPLGAEGFAA
jgi:hypothetical protein